MSERIKLNCDYLRADNITRCLIGFCHKANTTIIPLMQELKVKITLEGVIKYAGSSVALEVDFVEGEKSKSKVENAYLLQMIEQDAKTKFGEAFNKFPYDDFSTQYTDLLVLTEDGICENTKAIKEFCTTYLREDQREAYNRYMKAIDALNDFYRGNARFSLDSHFAVKDGKVTPFLRLINFNDYK